MNTNEVIAEAEAQLAAHGYGHWDIAPTATLPSGVLASTRYSSEMILISKIALNGNAKLLKTLLAHEIAHVICGYDADHNGEWAATCIALGGDGQRGVELAA